MTKQTTKDFLVGCSLFTLLYIHIFGLLFLATTPQGFFLAYSPNEYLAALAAVLFGGVVVAAISPLVRRAPHGVRHVASFLFLGTILVILNEVRQLKEESRPDVLNYLTAARHGVGLWVLAILALVVLMLAIYYSIPVARFYRRILLLLSVFAAFTMARGIWTLATINSRPYEQVVRHPHPGLPSAHRVVMVIFDEMDNEIAFTRRPKNLELPNFDSLRASSVMFDSTYSPGPNTIESMPSYLLGRRVQWLRPVGANSFVAQMKDGRRVVSDTVSSIFSRPAAMGARTAVVGFALPYCRLRLAAMVDRCEEIPMAGGESRSVQNESFWSAASEQMQSLLPFSERTTRIARLRVAIGIAADFAADASYTLVFLHLPIPHYPWIWDRHTNQFRVTILGDDGYLGNLALADRVLGQMRKEMTRSGTWDATTLIVTSDHPWRAKISQGRSTDRRIPFIIKLPGMKEPDHITVPVNSIVASALLPQLIDGQIPTAAALRLRVAQITAGDPTFHPDPLH